MFEKMEKLDLVEYDYDNGYTLTEAGRNMVEKINARVDTLKGKKAGTDLFPELAGVKDPAYMFLVEYMQLHNQKVHCFDLIPLINELQVAIRAGKIKKDHPLKSYINSCQDKLVNLYNSAQPGLFKVTISNRTQIASAIKKQIGLGFWPLLISAAAGEAAKFIVNKSFTKKEVEKMPEVVVEKTQIKGLGTVKANILAEGGFVTASDKSIAEKAPNVFRLPGEIGKLIQDVQRFKYAIALTGDPHAGKTELVMQIANAFAQIGDNVGMFMLEQGGMESKDTSAAVDRNITVENQKRVHITGSAEKGIETIKKFARSFPVVVIDSWQKLNLPGTRFDELRHEFPETIWIVIFQQNGEGGTRGGVAADYDTPVALKVHKVDNTRLLNWVEIKKNRGNSLNFKYMMATKKTMPIEQQTIEIKSNKKTAEKNDNAKN
jgi:hypothetical protein